MAPLRLAATAILVLVDLLLHIVMRLIDLADRLAPNASSQLSPARADRILQNVLTRIGQEPIR